MSDIAGVLSLEDVMSRLQVARPVFHSEADLQHAFGQVAHDLNSELRVRLEVPVRPDGAIPATGPRLRTPYLDLLCFTAKGTTAIEFKYFTRAWKGEVTAVGPDGPVRERYALRSHAATDLSRLHFIHDIHRLERMCEEGHADNGLAILLTNAPTLWKVPKTEATTNDRQFRIHHGRTLAGTLRWTGRDYPGNTRTLGGSYDMAWRDYSILNGSEEFRWLSVNVVTRRP